MSRERIKLVFFVIELNSGGAEWCLARLADSLPREEFEPRVLCMHGDGEVADWLRDRGIPVASLGFDSPLKFWRLAKLARVFLGFRPQLLHTWMFHANLVGKLAGRLCGVPSVLASLRVAEKERRLHFLLERLTAFLNDRIICNSSGLWDYAIRRGLPAAKLLVIPNDCDLALFPFADRVFAPASPFRILFLGRISRQKGLRSLIEASAALKRRLVIFQVEVVGAVEDAEYLRQCRELIAANELAAEFRFRPPLPHTEIPRLMRDCHLLVLPSLWEGMPNAVLEAFSSGLPVLATRIEGSADLIRDGETGLLAEPGDTPGLTEKMLWGLGHYDCLREMSRAARRLVERGHAPAIVHARYHELYRQLAQKA